MKQGFVTALGTPLDAQGNLVVASFTKHIDDQIGAGAAGLLVMGTMGRLGTIRESVYESVVRAAAEAIAGRVPLLVGISDNSLAKVREKLTILERYPVDVAVLTAPYYFQMNETVLTNFFSQVAGMTTMDIYLYDHLPITKHKITYPMMRKLAQLPNVKGIKSGDLVLIKTLHDDPQLKADFLPIFSGSDLFAVAQAYGIKRYLDGIFACFPKTIADIQRCFDLDDLPGATAGLNRMMQARDEMIALGIWPAFTCAMNLLGYEGNFAPDYEAPLDSANCQKVACILQDCGEL